MTAIATDVTLRNSTSLTIKENVIIAVDNTFEFFTGFSKEEVYNRPVSKVFNELLKMRVDVDVLIMEQQKRPHLMFTKYNEEKEIEISIRLESDSNIIVCSLIELSDISLNEKFNFLKMQFVDNVVGIAVYSVPDLILLKANQRYLDSLEYPFNRLENGIGNPVSELIKGWTGSKLESIWDTVLKTQKPQYLKEQVVERKDKGITYWNKTITPVFEKGECRYIYSYNEEITDKITAKKQLEEKSEIIRQQKEQSESIIENMNDGLSIFDKNGKYIKFNAAAKRMFFPSYEYMGKAGDGYYQAEYFDTAGKAISNENIPACRVIRGEKFSGMRMNAKFPDKTLNIDVSGTPIYDKDGEFLLGILCSRDVTQHTKDEEIIIKQKEELEAIIDSMSDGLFIVDKNEQIKCLNESAGNFFHMAESQQQMWDEIEHTKYYDAGGNEVLLAEFLNKRLLTGEKFRSFRLTAERTDGIKHFDVSGSPIYDTNGHVKSVVICMRDVTEFVDNDRLIREQRESLLRSEIEKNQILEKTITMKDEFLSTISHEFKTPLNVINSAIQAMELLCKDELSLKAKRYIKSIKQNTFRQLRLVNNLLDITRVQSGNIKIHKKNVDIVFISKSIVESVSLYAQQKLIKLEFVTTLKEKIIGMDEEKYERLLLNLLSNAIKFTPEKKQITVKLSLKKSYVRIEVKDNGVGIPKDKQEIIFERFGQVDSSLTRQAEGTGIGLSLVKLLVNALGGQISVKSEVGKGSSFIVLLPDEKVQDSSKEKTLQNLADNRLIQSIAIEFSDIYLS